MQQLEEASITCPYCAEALVVLLDCSADDQSYFEDCQVCCRPINISYAIDNEGIPMDLVARRDDE